MNPLHWLWIGALMVLIAFGVAWNARSQGYAFLRSFVFGMIAQAMMAVLIWKALTS